MASPRKDALPAPPKVTMHNTLVRASHGLNLGEKRLISLAVAKLSPKAAALPTKPIRISAREFAEEYGLDQSGAYKQLRAAQEKLWNRTIRHIEHYGKNGTKVEVVKMRWVTSARYKDHEGEIGISFSPEIAQFLVQLKKHFTSYQLRQAAALRSVYSWRLYENLQSHESLGKWKVDIERFHAVMETPKSYQTNFAQTRRWVLEPAISELAEKCALDVTVEPKKRGRKIVSLVFRFEPIRQMALPFDLESVKSPALTESK
jgi:plasmid replication initiation protein